MINVQLDRVTVVGSFKQASAEKLGEYLRPIGWQDMSFDWEHGIVDGYVLKRLLNGDARHHPPEVLHGVAASSSWGWPQEGTRPCCRGR